jgi:DNA-binding response OmpR family regulator
MGTSGIRSLDTDTNVSLLLIDDDLELCRLIGLYLGKAGYSLTCTANGRDGVIEAISNACDLVCWT